MKVLEVHNMSKNYGEIEVLKDVSFSVTENEVVGLVGYKGAGKTTLIESIIGLRKGYKGNVKLFGESLDKDVKELKKHIGVQLQGNRINEMMKVYECIEFQAAAFGVKADVDQLLDRFHLLSYRKKYFSRLPRELQQRLLILLSVVHNPSLVFYDELTKDLDMEARKNIYKYIEDLKQDGKTVVLSMDEIDETQRIFDRVIMLQEGRIVNVDPSKKWIDNLGYKYILSFESLYQIDELMSCFRDIKDVPPIFQGDVPESRYWMEILTSVQYDEIRCLMEFNSEMFRFLNVEHVTTSHIDDKKE